MSPPEVEPLVCRKYEIKRRLGKGAYGIVWRATDRQTGETVAVKKIFDAFRNRTDAQRTFREIMFLQEFGEHPNIIKLLDVIQAENDKDIYLIFESMETDLHAVIKKGNLLKDIHKCYILYQLLKATKFIHSGNVIHRDQKPSNVLLDAQCRVKLCDFGLARSLCQRGEPQPSPVLTEYVATRWYRAPEILMASRRYTKGVDMWSIGCILGEMLLGKPLFPGTSTMNQIEKILRVIPAPSPEGRTLLCGKGSREGDQWKKAAWLGQGRRYLIHSGTFLKWEAFQRNSNPHLKRPPKAKPFSINSTSAASLSSAPKARNCLYTREQTRLRRLRNW